MCQELAGRYAGHAGAVFVAGDVGGHQRRTSADSTDWKIIEQALARTFRDVRIYVGTDSQNKEACTVFGTRATTRSPSAPRWPRTCGGRSNRSALAVRSCGDRVPGGRWPR